MKQYILVKNSNNSEVQGKAKLHFFQVHKCLLRVAAVPWREPLGYDYNAELAAWQGGTCTGEKTKKFLLMRMIPIDKGKNLWYAKR